MHACIFCIVFIGWERAKPLVSCSAHSRYSIHEDGIREDGKEREGMEKRGEEEYKEERKGWR